MSNLTILQHPSYYTLMNIIYSGDWEFKFLGIYNVYSMWDGDGVIGLQYQGIIFFGCAFYGSGHFLSRLHS